MQFTLLDARGKHYGDIIINKIEDLMDLQFVNELNLDNDKLIVDFKDMSIMIYNDYIE